MPQQQAKASQSLTAAALAASTLAFTWRRRRGVDFVADMCLATTVNSSNISSRAASKIRLERTLNRDQPGRLNGQLRAEC